ncbi:hypothetical protein LMS44_07015 [Halomonas profundus]|jgi:hypothetical protein|uniref:DUF4214 domain-containing protein n=2 Tax=Vreelandella titanicae TaxID=664683 RepID=L9U7H4_9GAMM|nr:MULTISPECIES: hypothetical protein [Halomonas]UEQ05608.1 hypothetical protein LMS44_07015 [Halomonas profundus]ELY20747.1 hypothetical protein HALTITAN_2593 [Halomonas titanicae BH1]MCD1586421.1 hypothetical protein [Halomonas sp. IOP_14]MCE7516514.1 hypothetical protein [Halomonas titanicae]NVE92393.1 hypothetical protein [Halomonas titanicae]|tara:strand:- start:1090 stop:1890 length:801 start_codon:yes stop_codon:yes gene_type:complete
MTNVEQDIDTLVKRLKDQAMLADTQDSLAIESWLWLWQQRLVPILQTQQHRLYDPRAPRLAELLSAHLDDQAFVERAYSFLMGRMPDQQGARYHSELAAREGRVATLMILLQATETQDYIKQERLELPRGLLRLNRWHRRLTALSGVCRRGLWGWKVIVNLLWRRYQQRWKEEGEFYDILVHQGQRREEYQALAITLTEMADIQQKMMTLGIALPDTSRPGASLSQAASSQAKPPIKWLSDEQAAAMIKLLRDALRGLKANHKEAP